MPQTDGATLGAWRRSRREPGGAIIRKWTGRESRALREAMRLSLRDFADRLGVSDRAVSKWEAGGGGSVPGPDSQAILDTTLRERVSDEERTRFELTLGGISTDGQAGRDADAKGSRGALEDIEVDRTQSQASLIVVRSAGAELSDLGQFEVLRQQMSDALSRGSMSDASLDDWERSVVRYGRATRDRPASILLADISEDLAELTRLLNQRHTASALRRLTRVTAQMSGLMCLMFCLLDDRPAFRRWARTAVIAANEAGDSETLSWILAQVAHGYYYGGEISEAIEIARNAGEATQMPCAGTALASALEARGHAIQGNKAATLGALSRAEEILSRLSADEITPSAFGYNEASFRFHEGNALTHLRDVKRAFIAQERALALCSQDNYNDWAMTRLDRAQCLIYDGNASGGLAYAAETMLNLSEDQRRGVITLRGHAIAANLSASEQKLVEARDLEEILMLTSGDREDRQ
jgi:transcriptional regulator with XRE-family HTH domain/tetratricopeptide (TPR) repeat protein